ncbi:MAG: LLM class flavin-dependent oxidoreductase [Deltaproteobacteria bacterium]|nr:LLM class flavin-dependent oxidoreductase [Deltaproteobacteria bacterium]
MASAASEKRRYWGFLNPMPAPLLGMIAKGAEAQGLTGLFAPQVYGPPFVPLAAAAMVTERVLLASGIAIAAARSPFETAMAALDVDRISGGRFVLGLGASVLSWTRDVFGAPEHKPLAHLRETVAAVRHVIRGAHKGLAPFEGQYFRASFRELQGTAPPVRDEIPIWIAALRGPLVRLAAEIAQGVMGHPMWSIDWAVEKIQPDLRAGLAKGGRKREDIDLNLWLWVAINPDEKEAIEDSRATIAFYAGVQQYESFFEAHGFGREARRLQDAVKSKQALASGHLVPDEMVRAFVLCGKADAVRERLERAWTVADSMCLVPPAYGMPPEKLLFYGQGIAKTFYA